MAYKNKSKTFEYNNDFNRNNYVVVIARNERRTSVRLFSCLKTGEERRKAAPGKEGKLGVEGMSREIILEALRKAGATIEGEESVQANQITKQDLMELGLSGGTNSGERRLALLKKLNLPERMSPNAMLQALNLLYSMEELTKIMETLEY